MRPATDAPPGVGHEAQKKADVAKCPKAIDHVGLLSNEPLGEPGCSLFSHPNSCHTSAEPRLFSPRRLRHRHPTAQVLESKD
jgi:hypothetical protein